MDDAPIDDINAINDDITELRIIAENCSNDPMLYGDPMKTYETAERAVDEIEPMIGALSGLAVNDKTDTILLNYVRALVATSIAAFNAVEYVTQSENLNLEASIHAAEACLENLQIGITPDRCSHCLNLANEALELSNGIMVDAYQMSESGTMLFNVAESLNPSISVETFNASTIAERVREAVELRINVLRLLTECNAVHKRVEAIHFMATEMNNEAIRTRTYMEEFYKRKSKSNRAAPKPPSRHEGGAKCSRKTCKPRKLRKPCKPRKLRKTCKPRKLRKTHRGK